MKSVLLKANLDPSALSIYLIREKISSGILNRSKPLTGSFNFAYSLHPFFSEIKLSQVGYPSDFILLGDSPGWINFKSPRFAGAGNGLPLVPLTWLGGMLARRTLRFWLGMSTVDSSGVVVAGRVGSSPLALRRPNAFGSSALLGLISDFHKVFFGGNCSVWRILTACGGRMPFYLASASEAKEKSGNTGYFSFC